MAGEVNWKGKYNELKAKFMESVDAAFRIGFEQGAQQATQQAAMEQQAKQQEMEAAAMGGGQGAPGADAQGPEAGDFADQQDPAPSVPPAGGQGVQPMQESEHPDGSELDQYIAKLESMLQKNEQLDVKDLIKTINDLKGFQKSQKEQLQLAKSARAIPEIAKALHKPKFKLGVQANKNLTTVAKSAVTMQHKIVSDIMSKWESEEKNASKSILSQLSVEGLTKQEE
jgi:hypothetical protein